MSLCVECDCGLCCDGTLYSRAPLTSEDLPIQNKLIVAVEAPASEQGEHPLRYFELPCKLCVNDSCSIHDQERPAICGDYSCKLLINHEEGRISTNEARLLVRDIKLLRARLRTQLEEFTGSKNLKSFRKLTKLAVDKLENMDEQELLPAFQQMLLDIAMMRVLLAKNFDSRLTRYTYLIDSEKVMQPLDTEPDSQKPLS